MKLKGLSKFLNRAPAAITPTMEPVKLRLARASSPIPHKAKGHSRLRMISAVSSPVLKVPLNRITASTSWALNSFQARVACSRLATGSGNSTTSAFRRERRWP